MIYKIVDGKLTKFVDKNGNHFKNSTTQSKREDTLKNKKYRDPKLYNFYNSAKWHNLSKRYRMKHIFCEKCLHEYHEGKRPLAKVRIANSVDHIKPIKTKDGYRLRWNPRNLMSLCHEHHSKKNRVDWTTKSDL